MNDKYTYNQLHRLFDCGLSYNYFTTVLIIQVTRPVTKQAMNPTDILHVGTRLHIYNTMNYDLSNLLCCSH